MDTAYRVSPLSSNDPERLGDYLLVGRLGVGGMGVVYLAETDDGTFVAIKLIHAALAADLEFVGRFRSEVERARQVPPFCTAEFVDADLDHDPPYLVVEYVDGPNLEEVVSERGPLQGGALHSLAVGVATALAGIHGADVIHRDLKPDNVLLPPGSPKVIDFGIARPVDATSLHTRPDVMVGTVAYMAPERFSGDPSTPVTAAADIFAWGCVIAYAGTGRTPFQGDSPSATAGRILTQPPNLDGIPESLREPLSRALAKDPADRPTAQELVAMLLAGPSEQRPAAAGKPTAPPTTPLPATPPPTTPQPATTPPVRRAAGTRRTLVGALVAVLVLGGAALVYGTVNGTDTPRTTAHLPNTTLAESPAPTPSASGSPARPPEESASPSSSETRTSRPAADDGPSPTPLAVQASTNPSRRNLALGRRVTASSSEGSAWVPAHAVDGDPVSRWGSGFSDDQWLMVDLGGQWQISEILLRWEHAHAVSYRVEISADGDAWKTVYDTSAGRGGDVTITTDRVPGRYVRMTGTVRSGHYGYSLYEIEVR
ncbi:protein kinase [Polymorphospora rubra]|uniref:protein kinase domain-containing protein n=1 Tax=Polymorphospora rubra TaxID=338584 RepID=UPI0033CC3537